MTKDELKQEAEEYGIDLCAYCRECEGEKPCQHKLDAMHGYQDGLKAREKRIAELERKLKVETELSNRLGLAYREYEQLTKEQDEHLAELEAQIEKMKWHIVADGDLPKDRRNVYVVYLNGEYLYEKTIASYRYKYWVIDGHKTECEIVAWYELPTWGR